MNRMQIYIPEELWENLKAEAAIKDVSMSEIVRRGLKKVLKVDGDKADPMKVFVGKCRIKTKTNAVKEVVNYYHKKAV